MKLPKGAMVAVADGETLQMYRNGGDAGHLSLSALPAVSPKGENRGSGGRHQSSSANPDESRLEEDSFAAATAEWLNKQVLDHKLEALVVIAAPKTLGELRKHYHKQLTAALLGELSKDLAGRPVAEIEAAIEHA